MLSSRFFSGGRKGRPGRPEAAAQPLSECRGCSRFRVCKVSGDRGLCGRMASLGLLPGALLDLLCPACGCGQRQCMVKINGGTISLDALSAASIFVEPA